MSRRGYVLALGSNPWAARHGGAGRWWGRARRLVGGSAALTLIGCTLLAPEDSELLGGSAGAGGAAGSSGGIGSVDAGGAAGTTPGGAAGAAGGENCHNGQDDDGDDLIDCEDEDCKQAGYQCVTAPPQDWQGPFALYSGEGPPPECPKAFPNLAASGGLELSYADATCPSCSCAKPTNLKCQSRIGFGYAPFCTFGATIQPEGCSDISHSSFADFVKKDVILTGNCEPESTGAKSTTPFTWETQRAICGAEELGGGCKQGAVCAGSAPLPFGTRLCIARQGAHSCPTPFTQQFDLFADTTDTRDCSPCQCAAVKGAYCKSTVKRYGDVGCGGTGSEMSSCSKLFGTIRSVDVTTTLSGTPSCKASGGDPTGSVDKVDQHTVCCLP